ncbi:hypothetical protein [Pseudonocardia nigra]|uniref:hypothetical protein n=1 Tax=Pseudonocardia nigra TaxID=1921578 RepID=UPI0027E3927E|nr:hypothetical protein [Pseudonocardia nigra]
MLAVDVSPWLRSDAPTSAQRLFCHVYGRGRGNSPPAAGRTPSSPLWRRAGPRGRRCWTRSGSGPPMTPPRSPPSSCAPWSGG